MLKLEKYSIGTGDRFGKEAAAHIGLKTVDLFMESSDFFTLDVADFIGEKAPEVDIDNFMIF